jgi:hypothetical protein
MTTDTDNNDKLIMTKEPRFRDGNDVDADAAVVDKQQADHNNKKRRRLSKQQRKSLKKKQQKKNKHQSADEKPSENNSQEQQKQQKTAKEEEEESDEVKQNKAKIGNTKNNYNNNNDDDDDDDDEEDEERINHKCLQTYTPTPIPKQPSADLLKLNDNKGNSNNNTKDSNDAIADEGGCRTLGKWFPNAIFIKSSINYTNTGKLILTNDGQNNHNTLKEHDVRVDNPKSSLVLFYQYTTSADSQATTHWDRRQLQLLMTYLSVIARRRNLGGRIRVAPEGVNATISAVDTTEVTAQESLRHFALDLKEFDSKVFTNTDFKYFDGLPPDRHFKELKILPVQELVFYDIGEDEAPLIRYHQIQKRKTNTDSQTLNEHEEGATIVSGGGAAAAAVCGGVHLDAKEYHKMLQKDNTVVIGKCDLL